MYPLKRLKILLLGLFISSGLFAQSNQIFLDLQILNANAQVFPLGDLDFTNTGQVPNYFTLQLDNRSQTETFRIELRLRIRLNGTLIVEGISDRFDLPPNSMNMITSQQLNSGTALVAGQQVGMEFDENNIDFDAIEDLESQILQTGRAPSGNYSFEMVAVILDAPGGPIEVPDNDPNNNNISITNPTYIELAFPGRSVSENMIMEIATTFPYFQWYTDVNPAAASYNIFVYERLPTDETTQDVLSHPPILQLMNYQESFFQYPSQSSPTFSSGQAVGPVRLLEEGKTYYWKVESVVPTGTGNLVLESDVYRFKITDLGQGAQSSQQILAFLEQILGPENESFLRQLREQGFEPNGNLSLDGNDVQVNKLLEYLIKVNSGEASIDQVRIY